MNQNKKISGWIETFAKGKLKPMELLVKVAGEFEDKNLPYLFSSLFTKDEIKTFANRLLIIKKLKENMSQHEIAHKLKVGVTTVTRGAHEIDAGKFDFI